MAHYSLDYRLSVGAHGMREVYEDDILYGMTSYTGVLLKRWNDFHYQANIYAFGGLGGLKIDDSSKFAGMIGAQADIEDRRWLLATKFQSMQIRSFRDFYTYQFRFGHAPYEADYDELNVWLIGEYELEAHQTQKHDFSPLLRVFYRNFLLEAGSGFRGNWKLNLMFHF